MMKEKTTSPKRVKGTVLFTVVSVMMILIVFLTATLALAATANTRAMRNYSTVQTQQTSKAAVNAILSAMQNDSQLAKRIALMKKGNTFTVDAVTFEGATGSAGSYSYSKQGSYGRVEDAVIEYTGSKWVLDEEGNPVEKGLFKISATAVQGTASSTSTMYLLRDPIISNNGDGENQGFVATGAAVSHNHTSVYGGAYIGFEDAMRNWSALPSPDYVYTTYSFKDAASVFETDMQVNGTLTNDSGSDIELVIKDAGTGLTVWGDVLLSHPLVLHTANASVSKFSATNALDYKKIPYIYAEGKFRVNDTAEQVGNSDIPLNIFCDKLEITSGSKQPRVYADVYAYGTGTSTISGVQPSTGLYKWTANVIESGKSTGSTHSAGNFYSKGSLTIGSNGAHFDGDIVLEGDLILNGNLTCDGDVKVAGQLRTNGKTLTIKSGKKVYCDSSHIDDSTKISGGSIVDLNLGVTLQSGGYYKLADGYTYTDDMYTVSNDKVFTTTTPNIKAYKIAILDGAGNLRTDAGGNAYADEWNDHNWEIIQTSDGSRNVYELEDSRKLMEVSSSAYVVTDYEIPNPAANAAEPWIPATITYKTAVIDGGSMVYYDQWGYQTWDVIQTSDGRYYAYNFCGVSPKCDAPAGTQIVRNCDVITGYTTVNTTYKTVVENSSGDIVYRDASNYHTLTFNTQNGCYYEGGSFVCKGCDRTYYYNGAEASEVDAWEWVPAVYRKTDGTLTSSSGIFPAQYEKDVILGLRNPDGTVATTTDYKIIRTVPEVLASASDPYNTNFAVEAGYDVSQVLTLGSSEENSGYWTYSGNPKKYVVTNSCTIKGSVSDGTAVTIVAPATGSEIWVVLDNVSINGGYFIIDDSQSKGKVNLLVKGNCNFGGTPSATVTMASGDTFPNMSYAFLGCYTIAKQMSDNSKPHQMYTSDALAIRNADGTLKYERVNLPVLNIYSEASGAKLTVSNNTAMTAFVKAPYLDFVQASTGGADLGTKLYYNGFDVDNAATTQIGCIGCLICHNFTAGNNWMLLYSGSDGGTTTPTLVEDAYMNIWEILNYENY